MSPSPIRDLVVGVFVIAGIAAIAYLSLNIGGFRWSGGERRVLYARFDEIGGLKERAKVVIGGVPVGEVVSIHLDDEYRARVRLAVDSSLEIPDDTSASILTSGLLGDQFLALEPGGEESNLENGGEISFTQDAVVIERLIGRLVQNLGVAD